MPSGKHPKVVLSSRNSQDDDFSLALRKVLQVSKLDLNRMLAEEKALNIGKVKRGPKPKTSSSAHASDSSD
jgi:hypothetical protein